jgi:hypothetical protein
LQAFWRTQQKAPFCRACAPEVPEPSLVNFEQSISDPAAIVN